MSRKTRQEIEYGDFQTPNDLAIKALAVIAGRGIKPKSIVEPTCGEGSFLFAALRQFPMAENAIGVEINPKYFRQVATRLGDERPRQTVDLHFADFFTFDWKREFADLTDPIVIVGNPPWVTAAELGALNSKNLPVKSNFQNHQGLDAVTGKSNFDIAEWMLIHLLECASGKHATLGMLVKSAVARKVLVHAWKVGLPVSGAGLYEFDAGEHFGVGVHASLLVCDLAPGTQPVQECQVYQLDQPNKCDHTITFDGGRILADMETYQRLKGLRQDENAPQSNRWRSGVKHDCSRVMELRKADGQYRNGLGEVVDLEDTYLFPMLKGSAVAKNGQGLGERFMIVTQTHTGEDTLQIKASAPKTWQYLCRHADKLAKRGSTIYRNRPRFSVFGVGPYTFAPWKVAICGLYKKLEFTIVGPYNDRPVVFDDTVYQLSFDNEREAKLVTELLNSDVASEFLASQVFWDAKRPVTVDLLMRLSLTALAQHLGRDREMPVSLAGGNTALQLAGELF